MRLTVLLLLASTFQVNANNHAQSVTLNVKNAPLSKVLGEIKKQSGSYLVYEKGEIKKAIAVTMNVVNVSLDHALAEIFKDQPLLYKIDGRFITISAKPLMPVAAAVTAQAAILPAPPAAIQGVVTNDKGEPLAGVSVMEKGTRNVVVTDAAGKFSIRVNEGAVLQFSYVGYGTRELRVKDQSPLSVRLVAVTTALDDIVVVGYGTQKKVSLTSAITQVKNDELNRRPVSNLQQALQGEAPGLTVLDRGGEPGKTSATIRVRGITTFSGNTDNSSPLIIVDGVEQTFFNLNPQDVETISILKDASSTAIYGSRAANGVLLVTTKRGKSGAIKVSYNAYYAVQSSMNSPKMMELKDYMQYEQLAYTNSGLAVPVRYQDTSITTWVNATDRYRYPLPNTWFQTVLKSAPQVSHNISFSGGNENLRARVSVRLMDQGGIAPNYSSSIREIRMNNDLKISSRLKLGMDMNYRYNFSGAPYSGDVFNRFLHGTLWAAPKYPNGTYGLSPQGFNPLLLAESSGYNKITTHYAYGTAKLEYEVMKDLSFTAQFSGVFSLQEQKQFQNAVNNYDSITGLRYQVANNSLTENRTRYYEMTSNYLLNYRKKIKEHELQGLLGYSEVYNNGNSISAYRERFYNNSIQSLGQGANDATKNNGGSEYEYGLRSAFARINYAYNSKYLLEMNGRYDGSSRFAPEKQYSFFPSFSGAWRISKENFFAGLKLPVNELKLRGSWGKTGNQTVPLYSYFASLSSGSYTFGGASVSTSSANSLADRTLTWETNTQTDIGLEGELFRNHVTFSVDYYKKRTTGILLALPLPAVVGFTSSNQNGGIIDNKGWEFTLAYRNDRTAKIRYSFAGNFSINNNEVVDLKGAGPFILASGASNGDLDPRYIVKTGLPFNAFWGYKTASYFQTAAEIASYPTYSPTGTKPGDVKYVDLNGDGKINADDMTMIGNPFPKYTFGLNAELSYKSFTLNVLFQGAAKVDTRLSGALTELGIAEGFTTSLVSNNFWTASNTDARFPLPRKNDFRNVATSDRLIINGSYFRVKNVQLSYLVSQDLCKKLKIAGANVYASASNLLTFSRLNEWSIDPEAESGRGTYYPQTRVVTFGLNINF